MAMSDRAHLWIFPIVSGFRVAADIQARALTERIPEQINNFIASVYGDLCQLAVSFKNVALFLARWACLGAHS